ncbi:MAG: hypothetical protein WA956_07975 [Stenotrophomonas sp.]
MPRLAECLRLYARWWVARGWTSPRAWRAIAICVVALALLLAVFRQPLAERFWPESRIQQLLDEGGQALREGRLSVGDGSGARQHFEAAAALDPDRRDVQDALVATGRAALEQARRHLAAGEIKAADEALALARELQMPRADIDAIAVQLQAGGQGRGSFLPLLQRADQAQAQGRLDDGPDSALPLYQQVLALQPDQMRALEGRDAALSELLAAATDDAARGQLQQAAQRLRRVEHYDAGHSELPAARSALNATLEQHRRRAERDLARGCLDKAGEGFMQLLAVNEDPLARQGLQRVAQEQAREAGRLAGDFHFDTAEQALARARELAPGSPEVTAAELALQRARAAAQAMTSTLSPAAREQRIKSLLARMAEAESRGQWLLPPGASAYDHFKAAQALAADDARVRQAAARLLPAARGCLEENLRGNRLQAARACLDAWQALAAGDAGLPTARRRLAQRWLAVGSERLGAGDTGFAARALEQARELDPATPELAAFAERVGSAKRQERVERNE